MPGNFKHDDLRVIKTNKALLEALPKLLSQRSFGRITVNDICEEAQMSRTAFYSHFNDKYDLLICWLMKQSLKIKSISNNYIEIEKAINDAVDNNKSVITNLVEDANTETLELIKEVVSSILAEFMGIDNTNKNDPFCIVLHCFCIGGIINLVLWQIKNKFPVDLKMINIHFYDLLEAIRKLEHNEFDGGAENEKWFS